MAKPSVKLGEVFAFPLRRGGWGACQVVRVDARDVEVAALDHYGDARPTLATVPRAPLLEDSYFWDAAPLREHVVGDPPGDFVRLGVCDPVLPADPPSNRYAHWTNLPAVVAQYRAWMRIPEAARVAFRRSATRRAQRKIAWPGGSGTAYENTSALVVATGSALAPNGAFRVPDPSKLDWRAFDALPCLTRVEVYGEAPGMLAWLATRPVVNELVWHRPALASIDLSRVELSCVTVEPGGPCEVTFSPAIERLSVWSDDRSPFVARIPDEAAALSLAVTTRDGGALSLLSGVTRPSELRVASFARFDCALLRRFTSLRSLDLNSQHGTLTGTAHLASLEALRALNIRTCSAIDAAHMPALSAWPQMERLLVWGVRDVDAARLKKRWGKVRGVSVTSPQKSSWYEAHPNHPLMHWAHYAGSPQACGAFTAAMRALGAGRDPIKALQAFARSIERLESTRSIPYTDDERADLARAWDILVDRVADRSAATTLAAHRPRVCVAPLSSSSA